MQGVMMQGLSCRRRPCRVWRQAQLRLLWQLKCSPMGQPHQSELLASASAPARQVPGAAIPAKALLPWQRAADMPSDLLPVTVPGTPAQEPLTLHVAAVCAVAVANSSGQLSWHTVSRIDLLQAAV